MSKKWMMDHTAKPKPATKAIEGGGAESHQDKARSPPKEMIPPQPATVKVPSKDVSVKTLEAEQYRWLGKCGVERRYGWHDSVSKEMIMFDEDGALCLRQQSLKMEGQPKGKVSLWLSCPLPPNTPMTEFRDVMEQFKQVSHLTSVFGHLLAQWKKTTFIKALMNNYDLLYGHMDPNQPIKRRIPGWCEEITDSQHRHTVCG